MSRDLTADLEHEMVTLVAYRSLTGKDKFKQCVIIGATYVRSADTGVVSTDEFT